MTDVSTKYADEVLDRLWAVVPAGGAGTRLWPLSRASEPKFLLDLTGAGRTLLQQTHERLRPLVGDRLMIVTGQSHASAVADQVPIDPARIVVEPEPRDSMAAIGLAAALVERSDPDGVLASFAADHVILDEEAFRDCVREAVAVADTGLIVTIGIEPASASTAFGYIRAGEPLTGFGTAQRVEAFVEKPDAERAEAYVAAGVYRWNAGMFVARADALLAELAREHPEMTSQLRAIAADPESIDTRWPGLAKIAIDHAIAEPAAARGQVAMVPGNFGWDDVGDYASLAAIVGGEEPAVLGDRNLVTALDASGIVVARDRQICVVGLRDVVVVDTGDALLVTSLEQAQRVKEMVAALKNSGRDELT